MNFIKYRRGFTLLELLIVVGIIAVLTSIVLVSTGTVRNKGADAGVKINLHTVQNQAAILFSNNNTFGVDFVGGPGNGDFCSNAPTGSMFKDTVVVQAVNKAVSDGGTPPGGADPSWCYNTASIWAVAVTLKTDPSHSWCVDSSGAAIEKNAIPASSISATTHTCN